MSRRINYLQKLRAGSIQYMPYFQSTRRGGVSKSVIQDDMRVLVVGPDEQSRVLRAGFLRVSGFDVIVPRNTEEAAAAIWTTELDAMVLCCSLPSRDAVYLAQLFRQFQPNGCLVRISANTGPCPRIKADAQIPATAVPEAMSEAIRKTGVPRVA
jgi:CheY-like chemotaxis protein